MKAHKYNKEFKVCFRSKNDFNIFNQKNRILV